MIKHQWTTKIAMLRQRVFETLQPPLPYEPVPVLTIKIHIHTLRLKSLHKISIRQVITRTRI